MDKQSEIKKQIELLEEKKMVEVRRLRYVEATNYLNQIIELKNKLKAINSK